jgi:NAD(P)-dependent dehydrogenase (short-subunit alcohol dehydrogenase family)
MSNEAQKVALVTGAARGIGLATAKRFLAEGWRVALLDIDGDNLKRTYAVLARPETTIAITCDVADAEGVARAVAAIAEKFGRLDALVNNAGIAIFKPILDVTYEDWSRVLAVNLTGPFLCTQAAAPLMRDTGGGAIVNITSISGLRASTLRTAYGTSKAGLAHLTQQQAVELAALGIRVNAVAPAMASKKSWRKRSSSCAATAPATSPGRRLPSTAASRRPASACPRCARKAATASSAGYFAEIATVLNLSTKIRPLPGRENSRCGAGDRQRRPRPTPMLRAPCWPHFAYR